jgi:hypothetical protein
MFRAGVASSSVKGRCAMTMFPMKPKFNLAEFLAESKPKTSGKPKNLQTKKNSKINSSASERGALQKKKKSTQV